MLRIDGHFSATSYIQIIIIIKMKKTILFRSTFSMVGLEMIYSAAKGFWDIAKSSCKVIGQQGELKQELQEFRYERRMLNDWGSWIYLKICFSVLKVSQHTIFMIFSMWLNCKHEFQSYHIEKMVIVQPLKLRLASS